MGNLTSHIDEKLSDINMSNSLRNSIFQEIENGIGKEQHVMNKNRRFKYMIPVICIIAVITVGLSATAAIRHFFQPKEIKQSLEGETETISVVPDVKEPNSSENGYVIYIDSEVFTSEKKDGVEKISAIANPEAYMTISHAENTNFRDYISNVISETNQEIIAKDIKIDSIEDSLGVSYAAGNNYDDIITTIYAVNDGKSGCFIIKYVNTVEAAEGFGVRFQAMVNTFEVISE